MSKILICFAKPEVTERIKTIKQLFLERIPNSNLDFTHGYNFIEMSAIDGELIFNFHGYDLKTYSHVVMYNVGDQNIIYSNLIASYCQSQGIKYTNGNEVNFQENGKLLQKLRLTTAKINNIDFYYNSQLEGISYSKLCKFFNSTQFVIKTHGVSLGRGVYLINSEEELNSVIKEDRSKSHIYFERYTPHDFTYRGFVTGNKCSVQIKVAREEESFKTNRGKAEFSTDVDSRIKEIALSAAKTMHLDIAGVDMILDSKTKMFRVLEVNKAPGITIDPVSPEIDAIAEYVSNI